MMSNRTFSRNLKKILNRRLPQSSDYEWSRRVEGALVRSEESAAHETGAVIIDDELAQEQSEKLGESLIDYLSHDINFRRTKYKTIIWRESAFSAVHEHGGLSLCSIKGLATDIKSVITKGTVSGYWENFRELYKPHKAAGQVFLLTTQEKVDLLEQAKAMGIRNMVIIYPLTDDKERRGTINNIPCIPFAD